MKHIGTDYDQIQDPEHKIPEDEPVFLLRAQDKTAAAVVRCWAMLQENDDIAELALEQADAMDQWPTKKSADLDTPTITEAVNTAASRGLANVQAIKFIRQWSGCDLREAKRAWEAR